jgi:large subunit ribosomal protein L22
MIRGKKVEEARVILRYAVKGAAPLLAKVLDAAIANAEHAATENRQRVDTDEMIVQRIMIDGGPMSKRFGHAPRGRAVRVRRRTSHVSLWIGDGKN